MLVPPSFKAPRCWFLSHSKPRWYRRIWRGRPSSTCCHLATSQPLALGPELLWSHIDGTPVRFAIVAMRFDEGRSVLIDVGVDGGGEDAVVALVLQTLGGCAFCILCTFLPSRRFMVSIYHYNGDLSFPSRPLPLLPLSGYGVHLEGRRAETS